MEKLKCIFRPFFIGAFGFGILLLVGATPAQAQSVTFQGQSLTYVLDRNSGTMSVIDTSTSMLVGSMSLSEGMSIKPAGISTSERNTTTSGLTPCTFLETCGICCAEFDSAGNCVICNFCSQCVGGGGFCESVPC
jgi:hypothetical protein